MKLLETLILKLNGVVNCLTASDCPAENVLLLLPHCLQFSGCNVNVINDTHACVLCGKCPIGELTDISERLGIRHAVVAGGRKAVALCKDPEVKAIIAVACPKELSQGIVAVFPKKVIPVALSQPHGPCHNTSVEPQSVQKCVCSLIGE